jgi:hypothetical protein
MAPGVSWNFWLIFWSENESFYLLFSSGKKINFTLRKRNEGPEE